MSFNPGILASRRRTAVADLYWKDVVFQQVFASGTFDQAATPHLVNNQGLAIAENKLALDGSKVLYCADSADWLFSGDFCIDIWGANFTAIATDQWIISQHDSSVNQRSWMIGLSSSNTTIFGQLSTNGSAGTNVINTAYHISAGVAYDVRLERSGTTVRLFIDGNMKASATVSGSLFNASRSMLIGARYQNSVVSEYMTGSLKAIRITKAARHGSDLDYTVESLPLATVASVDVQLYSFGAGSRTEWFIDRTNVASSASVVFGVQKPVRYAVNPVSPNGANSGTWDRDKYYINAIYDSGTYKVWSGVQNDAGAYQGTTYETSADGQTFTKPNLAQVTYGGDTNNNLITLEYDPSVVKDGATYIIQIGADSAGATNNQALIYTSATGYDSLTLVKTLSRGTYSEFHGFGKRSDGRWLSYYRINEGTEARSIGAFLSDTTDYTGTWTDQGTLLTSVYASNQFYYLHPTLINDVMYGIVGRYDSVNGNIVWMELYTSTNGTTWTLRRTGWFPVGAAGSYDGGMAFGKTLLDDGSELRLYFGGSVGDNADASPRDSRICYAALTSGRLGIVTGPGGTVTTTAFTPTDELRINAKSSGGNLKVELLNSSDVVLTGFAKTDCDNLDGDWTAKIVTWAGASILAAAAPLKIKFYLDA